MMGINSYLAVPVATWTAGYTDLDQRGPGRMKGFKDWNGYLPDM